MMSVPEGFQEVKHLVLTEPRRLIWLNVLSIALIVPFLGLMTVWALLVRELRGVTLGGDPGLIVGWGLVLLVFVFHEWLHGVGIRWAGYTPRYGVKSFKLGFIPIPYVLYATADDALFPRNAFIVVALLPVVVITMLGMFLMVILPEGAWAYIVIGVVLNGGGAIGDLWMTWVVVNYPPDVLVRDEADSIRVFARETA